MSNYKYQHDWKSLSRTDWKRLSNQEAKELDELERLVELGCLMRIADSLERLVQLAECGNVREAFVQIQKGSRALQRMDKRMSERTPLKGRRAK